MISGVRAKALTPFIRSDPIHPDLGVRVSTLTPYVGLKDHGTLAIQDHALFTVQAHRLAQGR
ncbi:hypothetical protein MNKW57_19590 [Biformimicrobium ophioploci]|uniref:Uncharacterized protein n=1 Tax=Biformimicrobium ophioploci TaxID=3036711 RepID=A0ABQ6LZY8_9GAMM|nr:hypothetical protein MNKW57_19590 [Microbulbifer sp. NKW57]